MAYSNAEIKAFAERDRRIVRQSSLKVAADLVIAADNGKSDLAVLNLATQTVAQELTDWVYEQDTTPSDEPDKAREPKKEMSEKQLPEPTLAQKKVLDRIAGKQNKTQADPQLKTDVLDWAEETHGQRSYPTKLESVEIFLKWHKAL